MDESGDEEETEGIVNKVLDEIGIEISGKVCYLKTKVRYPSWNQMESVHNSCWYGLGWELVKIFHFVTDNLTI